MSLRSHLIKFTLHLVIVVWVLAVVADAVVLVEQVRGVIGSVICVRVDTSRTGVGMITGVGIIQIR